MILGQALVDGVTSPMEKLQGQSLNFGRGIVFPVGTAVDRYAHGAPVHPTMIYESLGNFLILALLWKLRLEIFVQECLGALFTLLLRFTFLIDTSTYGQSIFCRC
ncbi:MAG: hypothetical protein Ct9H300mP21_03490 [Pseudomonadota bacterium]|nr:MAG: hypothetical protein Ct9H300mP21_03490 [Pseudomonadota bacterium]